MSGRVIVRLRFFAGTLVLALAAATLLDAGERADGRTGVPAFSQQATLLSGVSGTDPFSESPDRSQADGEPDWIGPAESRFSEQLWLRYRPPSDRPLRMPRWMTLDAEATARRNQTEQTASAVPDELQKASSRQTGSDSGSRNAASKGKSRRDAGGAAKPAAGRGRQQAVSSRDRSSPQRPMGRRSGIRQVNWQPPPPAEDGEAFLDEAPDIPPPPPGDFSPQSEIVIPPQRVRIPLSGPDLTDRVELRSEQNGHISLIVRDAPLGFVLELLARQQALNIVAGHDVLEPISVTLSDVNFEDALDAILSVAGYTWVRQRNIILVTRIERNDRVLPQAQGREVRVFGLNFVAAADVLPVVEGLLSPIGRAFSVRTDPLDNRRTREQIIVEDLPLFLLRITEYIAQVDQPPRQVLVEAHVLEVSLSDDTRHGVNFEYLSELANADIALRTRGFANPSASPAFIFDLDATDLNAVVEALKTTTDAKTLASPKVLVLNGQEARIQIGEQLGYFVTTTTETSTLQNVNFLELGVVLRVTPTISEDNQILLSVRPEVSSGQINDTTGLPEENTTEVDTTVLLPDGHGMVIGGLIKEELQDTQTKIPIVGSLWIVGNLFQRRTLKRERNEIVIVLIPRIVPYLCDYQPREDAEVGAATTRLTYGPLHRVPRPWEPRLPEACENPRWLKWKRLPDLFRGVHDPYPRPLEHYLPAADEVGTFHGDLLEED